MKSTFKKQEQNLINAEKEADHILKNASYSAYEKYINDIANEKRIKKAENKDSMNKIIQLMSKYPNEDLSGLEYFTVAGTAVASAITMAILANKGIVDLNNTQAISTGFAIGAGAGLGNMYCKMKKPLTNAIIDYRINRVNNKINKNNTRIQAIEHIQKCLNINDQDTQFETAENNNQISLFECMELDK